MYLSQMREVNLPKSHSAIYPIAKTSLFPFSFKIYWQFTKLVPFISILIFTFLETEVIYCVCITPNTDFIL